MKKRRFFDTFLTFLKKQPTEKNIPSSETSIFHVSKFHKKRPYVKFIFGKKNISHGGIFEFFFFVQKKIMIFYDFYMIAINHYIFNNHIC